jgi:hypothetical protein
VLEKRILRRIHGPKREVVRGGWRRLHNVELHNLYTSPYISKVIKSRKTRVVGRVARMKEMRKGYKVFVGKSEGKNPLSTKILERILEK